MAEIIGTSFNPERYNPLKAVIACKEVAQQALDNLSDKNQQLARRLFNRNRLQSIALATALLVAAGCGNISNKEKTPVPPSPAVAAATFTPRPTETLTRTPTIRSSPSPTATETPTRVELPKDLIPRSELEQRYHIKIFDLPNIPDYVKLDFRASALVKEPHFKSYAAQGDQLSIYLINGPYLDPKFLTPEQANPEAIKLLQDFKNNKLSELRNQIQKEKPSKLIEYRTKLDNLNKNLTARTYSQDRYSVEKQALDFIYRVYLEDPTDEDLLMDAPGVTISGGSELRMNGTLMEVSKKISIFLAIRNSQSKVFQSGGEKMIVNYDSVRQPKPEQSYPSPDSFIIDRTNLNYPIQKGHTAATMLDHELQHAWGVGHPTTDYNVADRVAKGFKEDVDYYWIVFQTPQGNVVSIPLGSTSKDRL